MKKFRNNLTHLGLILLWPMLLSAQDISPLYDLYENKQFGELKLELDRFKDKLNENSDLRFFNALFIEDGEAAIPIFESLVKGSTGLLRYHVTKKISEYYYAKGFYVRAAEWNAGNRTPAPENSTAPTLNAGYKIQVGAFSVHENAAKLKKYLESFDVQSEIVQRMVNNSRLYCVWIDGLENRVKTEQYAERLKTQINLNYQIIEP